MAESWWPARNLTLQCQRRGAGQGRAGGDGNVRAMDDIQDNKCVCAAQRPSIGERRRGNKSSAARNKFQTLRHSHFVPF
jgi:hypothetical protein